MTQKLVLDALGGIDEKYIMEAAQIRKNIPWKMMLVTAACLSLILTAVMLANHEVESPSVPTPLPTGNVIWGDGFGDLNIDILEQAEAGRIVLSEELLTAFEASDDSSDIFAIQVIEITGAAQEEIYEKFIQPLELGEDYLASGTIFATRVQVEQMECPEEFGFVFKLASKTPEVGNDYLSSTGCVISGRLINSLLGASENELFPVTICLHDHVDLTAVEKLAMERAGVTAEQLEGPDSLEAHDRFSAERIAILSEYYQKLNNDFLEDMGLAGTECDSISKLLPYIRGIRLTKTQIMQLSENERVQGMYLAEDSSAEDL